MLQCSIAMGARISSAFPMALRAASPFAFIKVFKKQHDRLLLRLDSRVRNSYDS
jgi:hypothetical protein